MEDFTFNQHDTVQKNFTIPRNLLFKEVYFLLSDGGNFKRKIKCVHASITLPDYKMWSEGGVRVVLTKDDLAKSGFFDGRFLIIDKLGNQTTYPEHSNYLIEVRAAI